MQDPVLAVMMNGPPLFSPALCTRASCSSWIGGVRRACRKTPGCFSGGLRFEMRPEFPHMCKKRLQEVNL